MKTVYIIEPDPVLLSVYTRELGSLGTRAMSFRTAKLAARALDKLIPDCVVLELALPTHNGFEFLYELNSYNDTSDVKVVIHSMLGEKNIPFGFVEKQSLNIVSYLHKPSTTLDQLKQAVIEAMNAD